MSDIAIQVENLGKAYCIGLADERHETLTGLMASWVKAPARNLRRLQRLNTFQRRLSGGGKHAKGTDDSAAEPVDVFWALRDVGFQVRRGEVVGVIGRNGAGKSTLLKILSRITDPTTGRAVIDGRVSSLLEVGTGFHPELTGRENIYMNGTILGMSKREIDRKFDQIVDFSGVEKFLDTPVKRYSSGMKVRLAFSVAAHLEPEILIIDEVLAVGDADFQKKCLGKMNDVAMSGRTVLFVSHNMAAVEHLCTRAFLLEKGELTTSGTVSDVIKRYLDSGILTSSNGFADLAGFPRSQVTLTPVVQSIRMTNDLGEPHTTIGIGQDTTFKVALKTAHRLSNVYLVLRLSTPAGIRVCTLHSRFQHKSPLHVSCGCVAVCTLKNCRLFPGDYYVSVLVKSNRDVIDEIENAMSFSVNQSDVFNTGILPSNRAGYYLPDIEWGFYNEEYTTIDTVSPAVQH